MRKIRSALSIRLDASIVTTHCETWTELAEAETIGAAVAP
ncbi:unnamed protein product [marine sediment metagenome]|uniref:Uncharacterized protein n=1 Tax=marine sediment metagenome TaxID=412755 RepID=X0X9D8_9ZZZZ